MLGRVWVVMVLTLLTAATVPTPVVDEAEAAFTAKLRTFPYQGIGAHEATFVLQTGESYDRYWLELDAHAEFIATDNPGVSAGFLEVRRFGTDDLVCRGEVGDYAGVRSLLNCDGLRIGHTYVVRVIATLPADVVVWGDDPMMPPPSGGFNPLNYLPL